MRRKEILYDYALRSMSSSGIIYPYWENIARGAEDILLVLTLFMLLFFAYPVIVIVVKLISLWRHRTWTAKSIWNKLRGGKFI